MSRHGAQRSTENRQSEDQEKMNETNRNFTSKQGGVADKEKKMNQPNNRDQQMGADVSNEEEEEEESGAEAADQPRNQWNKSEEVAKDSDDESEEAIGNT